MTNGAFKTGANTGVALLDSSYIYDVIGTMRVRLSDVRSSLSLSYLPYNVRLVFKTVEAMKCFDGVGTCNSFSKGLNQIK